MKNLKRILALIIFVSCATTTFAQSLLESQIQLKSPSAVSEDASEKSISNKSEFANNMFINGYVGAMGNMLNGNMTNAYSAQELQKQQIDYSKQQADYQAK